jgi:hypothetical protein
MMVLQPTACVKATRKNSILRRAHEVNTSCASPIMLNFFNKSLLQQPGRKSLYCFHLNRCFKTDTEPLNMNLTTDLSSGPSLRMIFVMRSVKKSEQPQLVTGRKNKIMSCPSFEFLGSKSSSPPKTTNSSSSSYSLSSSSPSFSASKSSKGRQ